MHPPIIPMLKKDFHSRTGMVERRTTPPQASERMNFRLRIPDILLSLVLLGAMIGCSGCDQVDAPGKLLKTPRERSELQIAGCWKTTAIGVISVLVFVLVWRRRHPLAMGAIASAVMLIVSILLWCSSYSGMKRIAVGFRTDSDGHLDWRKYACEWSRGGICFYMAPSRFEPGPPTDKIKRRSFEEQRSRPNPYFEWYKSPFLKYPAWNLKRSQRRDPHFWEPWGFKATSSNMDWGYDPGTAPFNWSVTAPLWFLVFLFSILPACWLTRTVRRLRRKRAGHCPKCNYDLRASTDRCPECGTPIPPPPSPPNPAPPKP